MSWHTDLLNQLAAKPIGGYGRDDSPASEPTALATLALVQAGRFDAARRAADWLIAVQAADGSVGVRATESTPGWPTSLAILAWRAMCNRELNGKFQFAVERGIAWTLQQSSVKLKSDDERGHDPTIDAWPWIDGTHAWVEPTALHVLALKAAGMREHPRTREAVRMLVDRQLPGGGWNYGNTVILGNELRAHDQSTGLALLALADETKPSGLVQKSTAFLRGRLSSEMTTMSLCWSLLGLAAHRQTPAETADWLEAAYQRVQRRDQSLLKLALIALARNGAIEPL